LYGVHYEALMPAATGKQLYAGYWDGWQFTRFNGEMLAGGAWQGRVLTDDDRTAFVAEMQQWGVRHLFVWSRNANARLSNWPEFKRVWQHDPWTEYELAYPIADPRLVTVEHGRGQLISTSPLGGVVRLGDVQKDDRVVVRTHFHPAWRVTSGGRELITDDHEGQLSFLAPAAGSYDVTLLYPARQWLLLFPVMAIAAAMIADQRWGRFTARSSSLAMT
jgi:hypothetical protein